MIVKIINDRVEDVCYCVIIEKKWISGWGYYEIDFNFGFELLVGINEEFYNIIGWGG